MSFFPEGPCAVSTKELLKLYEMFGPFMSDFDLPKCDRFGYYSPLQCNAGGCYCADPQGDVVEKLEWGNEEYCLSLRSDQAST